MELRHESYTAHCSGCQWKVAELVSISAYLLIQPPPLGIAPASVPSPRYRSCFSPLPSVSLLIQSPRRRGGRRAGATEEGRSPRGCHGGGAGAVRGCHGGGGAVAARVPRSRGGRCARVPRRRGGRRAGAPEEGWAPRGCHGGAGRRAGATEGLGAARVPRRGWAPRGCHGGGAAAARVPRRRGGRCAGAPEEGWAPRGCHGGGVSAARDNKTTHTNYHKPPQKHGDFWHLQTSPTVFYLTGRTSGETSVVCRPLRRTERPLFRKLRIPSRKIGRHNL